MMRVKYMVVIAHWERKAKRRSRNENGVLVYLNKMYVAKRRIKLYKGSSQLAQDANKMLAIRTQFDIRKKLRELYE
jgi:hypothetical protein